MKSLFTSTTLRLMTPVQRYWLVSILLLHLILVLAISSHQGLTYDENGYYNYVLKWRSGDYARSDVMDDSKTPVLALITAPLFVKRRFPIWWEKHIAGDYVRWSRIFMYPIFLLGALFSFILIYRLVGSNQWKLPFILLLFNPMVLSYALVVGSDIALMGLTVASVYLLWRFAQTQQLRYFFWLCVVTPLGLLTKQAYVYDVLLLTILFLHFYRQNPALRRWLSVRRFVLGVSWMIGAGVVIINSFFLWRQSFISLNNLPFQSHLLKSIQLHAGWLNNMPVPLPWGFLNGYDFLQLHKEWGILHPSASYMGVAIWNKYYGEGPLPTYYLMAALLKMPFVYWFLGIAGIFITIKHLFKSDSIYYWKKYGFVVISTVVLFLAISILNPFQSGFRHSLFIFPFVCILLGLIGQRLCQVIIGRYALIMISAISIAGMIRYGLYQMAYTNELVWNKYNVYSYLVDSSINYGQDMGWANNFAATNPEYKLNVPKQPQPGKYIIFSPSFYPPESLDQRLKSYKADWLIHNFKPIDLIHFTGMVYNVSLKDLKCKGLL